MTHVLLLHHAQARTPGCVEIADRLRAAGHVVHLPDLYEGRTFATLDEGVAHAKEVGFGTVAQRGLQAAGALSGDLVVAGMSLGLVPAVELVATRPGVRGALLLHGAMPVDGGWPAGVPAQVHVMEDDDWGDVDDARALAAGSDDVELFLYPGDRHLFSDASLAEQHDPEAAALLVERVLAFLDRLDRTAAEPPSAP